MFGKCTGNEHGDIIALFHSTIHLLSILNTDVGSNTSPR